MNVRILFFGPAKDHAGCESADLTLPDTASVADLRAVLAERFPNLRPLLTTVRIAINEQFAADDRRLRPGDEAAVIPPVSGGADPAAWVELIRDALPAARAERFVLSDPAVGGITTFQGATRLETDPVHGRLLHLDYEAYDAMAVRTLTRLADEARTRFHAGRTVILHRLGRVPVGEVSVLIAVACPHRAESFDACRFLIDALKSDAPIWKKDVYADGFTRWVQPS